MKTNKHFKSLKRHVSATPGDFTNCSSAHTQYRVFLSGGLAEEVDEKVLHAAFIPFGDITDIQIPLDYETGKIRSLAVMCSS